MRPSHGGRKVRTWTSAGLQRKRQEVSVDMSKCAQWEKRSFGAWTHCKTVNEAPTLSVYTLSTAASWCALGMAQAGQRKRMLQWTLHSYSRSCNQGLVGMGHGLEGLCVLTSCDGVLTSLLISSASSFRFAQVVKSNSTDKILAKTYQQSQIYLRLGGVKEHIADTWFNSWGPIEHVPKNKVWLWINHTQ